MNYSLDQILREQNLVRSKHDTMIKQVSDSTQISPNVETIYTSAYFKQSTKHKRWEGDIDLLQSFFDSKQYVGWEEVPFNKTTLLIWEMKTTDTTKSYHRAISQLKKEKLFLQTFTNYQSIDCFYCFGVGNSYSWRVEKEL